MEILDNLRGPAKPFYRKALRRLLELRDALLRPYKFALNIWLKLRLKQCGRRVEFESRVAIRNPWRIRIGNRCTFSTYVILDAA